MELEVPFLELKGLSKTFGIFHDLNSSAGENYVPPNDLWIKFLQIHINLANRSSDSLFRPWIHYLHTTLATSQIHLSLEPLLSSEPVNISSLPELLLKANETVSQVASYQERVAKYQLSFLDTNSISFSEDFLSEAVDYYTFWQAKFRKLLTKGDHKDIDVLYIMDSVKFFNRHHEEFQGSILHWPLPMGCHYPKFDNSLEVFFSNLPPPPATRFTSPEEYQNILVTWKVIIREEYGKGLDYLTSYMKQACIKAQAIFPSPEILDYRFKHYKEDLEEEIRIAFVPLRTTCKQYEDRMMNTPEDWVSPYLKVKSAMASVTSSGKVVVCVKRKLKEAIAKFLVRYYVDVKKRFKRDKNVILRLQKRRTGDLSYQIQLQNRLKAYDVWKGTLNEAIGEAKKCKLNVISNVAQAQLFYYKDFLNDITLGTSLDVTVTSFLSSFLKRE